jgi:alanyl-tRNA synthetase
MTSLTDIRRTYLEFFKNKAHVVLPSSSLVPHNDPTLMFTNAGMNQFKNVFTGAENPPNPPRAASAQKCVRAGGKHNDLDNVGYTTRHHTFFEMMGNFSFGDYFKEDAIAYAWELLTQEFKLDQSKLYFTVYHTDDEAFEIWKKVTGCDESRILRVPTNDNFWSMGDVGPCGPCSEIFYDHGAELSGEWALDETGHDLFDARYVEIWNLVFMQYEQKADGSRVNLPKPCVDTGMGLERMATVLQGKKDNYDIDLFTNLISAIKALSGGGETTASHKVIADHLRSCGFLIADGVLPSNEGRGYVLRRIMRRAMRHAHMLGCKEPLMHHLVPALIKEMGAHYAELGRAEALMTETLKGEEIRFKETLERGLKLLDEEIASLRGAEGDAAIHAASQNGSPRDCVARDDGVLSGEIAFKLYDTYGFPLDLTEDILRGQNMSVDQAGFDAAMAEQKARARAAWKGSGEAAVQEVWFDIRDEHGVTEFIGYAQHEAQALIRAIVKDGAKVQALKAGESGIIITNQTPFYGESGGQTGDVGVLQSDAASGTITDTTKPIAELHAHHVTLEEGTISIGDTVTLSINEAHRANVKAHHSATHLLHAALREVLGEHVTQKGSLVEADRLRFDISQPKALSDDEIEAVERRVNAVIRQNAAVKPELMDKDAAIEAGAMAMFGEKYDDEVRVLSMGEKRFSVELCGGTHVQKTGDIGLFKITSEGAVAAGVRRIEALAGQAAFHYLAAQDKALRSLAQSLQAKPDEVADKVSKLQADKKALEKELAEAKKQLAMGGASSGDEMVSEDINGIAFIGKSFGELPPKELRDIATQLAQQHESALIAVASAFEGKASVIIAVGKALEKVDASALIKIAVPVVGGKGGGGKPNFAQCGGPDGDKIADAIAAIKAALAQQKAA